MKKIIISLTVLMLSVQMSAQTNMDLQLREAERLAQVENPQNNVLLHEQYTGVTVMQPQVQPDPLSWMNTTHSGEGNSGEWIHWDQGIFDAGLGSANWINWHMAARFTPADLLVYEGKFLTKIKFFPADNAEFWVKVWQGSGNPVEIYSQAVPSPVLNEWNVVELDTPVPIDTSQEFWVGYRVLASMNSFPVGADQGPAVAGKGDMINITGHAWVSLSTQFGINRNWNIQGFVADIVSPDAPASPLNLAALAGSGGTLQADLSWTNPQETFGGQSLTDLDAVKVFRNGELVHTIENPVIGGNENFTDNNILENTIYAYTVLGENAAGQGASATVSLFVGPDVPAAVSNLSLQSLDGSGFISWTAPQIGYNGGFINPTNTTYSITRMPGSTPVVSGITATEYLDNSIPGIGNYFYIVTSHNEQGTGGSSTSNIVLLGDTGLLFWEDFNHQIGTLPPGWFLTGNANHTWGISGTALAGGEAPEMRMWFSPSSTGTSRLLTPPINLQGNQSLRLTFRQFLDDFIISDGEVIGVDVSFNAGSSWNVLWEQLINGDIPAQETELFFEVPSGTESIHLAFRFQGNSFNIDNWYIDNVALESTASNIMSFLPVEAEAGEDIIIELQISNEDSFVAFQLDVPLPAGFSLIPGSVQLETSRITDHLIQSNILPGTDILRIISFSLSNSAYTGNSGTIATFALASPEIPGTYSLPIQNAIMGDIQGNNILSGVVNGSITLTGDPIPEYTVTFEVFDNNSEPVSGAFVTFAGITNPAGDYVFTGIYSGTYDYEVSHPAYFPQSGSLEVTDGDISVAVLLELIPVPENIMQLHDVTALRGDDIEVELEITNESEFVAFQLDIPLPEGFQYLAGSVGLNEARKTDHQIQANVLPGTNLFRMISFSLTNAVYPGNSGVIASFALATPFLPGSYTLAVEDGIIGNIQGVNILTGTVDGTVTLTGDPLPQFSVEFVVEDQNQQALGDAVITLGNLTNPAGNYTFAGIFPGSYDYNVSMDGYNPASGSITVLDEDLTVNVTLEIIPVPENIIMLADVIAEAGDDLVVELQVNNDDEFVAFQLDVPLPPGFGFIDGTLELNPERTVDHLIQSNILPGTNIFRIISFSLTNSAYQGNSGILATFSLTTPQVPGVFLLNIENAILGAISGENILTGSVGASLTLTGDVQAFTVTFVVEDENQQPVPDAVITLGETTNPAGGYVFPEVFSGSYNYSVIRGGFVTVNASLVVFDQDLTITVTLQNSGGMLDPPAFLAVDVNDNNVDLLWGMFGGEWLSYTDDNPGFSFGLASPGTFRVAAYWPAASLQPYINTAVTRLSFIPNTDWYTYKVKIWKGQNAETLVAQQQVDFSDIVIGEWVEVMLNSPLGIEAGQDYWFGLEIYQSGSALPVYIDQGPAVAGFGDMINLGSGWVSLANTYNINGNFKLKTYVEGGAGLNVLANTSIPEAPLAPGLLEPVTGSELLETGSENITLNNLAGLLGFNVYRNGTRLNAELLTTVSYTDQDVEPGTYTYGVTAVYDLGESLPIEKTVQVAVEPMLVIEPASVSATLQGGDVFEQTLVLSNAGILPLEWEVNSLAAWLDLSAQSGVIESGESAEITLTVSAPGMPGGLNEFMILFNTNNLNNPVTFLPVSITIENPQNLAWSVQVLDFGMTPVMESKVMVVELFNMLDAKTFIYNVITSSPNFVAFPPTWAIEPNQSILIPVVFNPQAEQTYEDVLSVQYFNYAGSGWFDLDLTGQGIIMPPSNLTATTGEEEVTLNWLPPGALANELRFGNGEPFSAIGTSNGTYEVAARFAPMDLMPYANMQLDKVGFFIYEGNADFTLKVYVGENAGAPLLSLPLSDLTPGAWNDILLPEPIALSQVDYLWIGYEMVLPNFDFVAGVDGGPGVAGSGDLLRINGNMWTTLSAYGWSKNWNIRGLLSDAINTETIVELNSGSMKNSITNVGLIGYNIYRDGVKLNDEPIEETSFSDAIAAGITYDYGVTALYSYGESQPSNILVSLPQTMSMPLGWEFTPTGMVHNIHIPEDVLQVGMNLIPGDMIGVFYTDDYGIEKCAGAILWDGLHTVLHAYGNDPATPEKDGFDLDEELTWKVHMHEISATSGFNATYDHSMPHYEGHFKMMGLSMLEKLEIMTVGIEEPGFGSQNISMFPNPSSGMVNLSGLAAGHQVRVFDSNGRLVFTTNAVNNQMHFILDRAGLYLVEISNEKEVIRKKLIIH